MKIRYSAEYSVKIQNSVPVPVQTNLDFKIRYPVPVQLNQNFKILYSVFCYGSTKFKSQNSVSGSGWRNLNSFVPLSGAD